MPHQRKLLRQNSDSGDNKSTRVFSEVGDEDYNPSYTEAVQPQRIRRKISTFSRKLAVYLNPRLGLLRPAIAVTAPASSLLGHVARFESAEIVLQSLDFPLKKLNLARFTGEDRCNTNLQSQWSVG